MLDISDEVKSLFLKDSTKKKIVIEVDSPDGKDISDFNYYLGTPTFGYAWDHTINADGYQDIMCGYPYTSDFKDYADLQWDVYATKVRVSLSLHLTNITSDSGTLDFRCNIVRKSGTYEYEDVTVNTSDYTTKNRLEFASFDIDNDGDLIDYISLIEIHNSTNTTFSGNFGFDELQVELTNDTFPDEYITDFSKGIDITKYIKTPAIEGENVEFESFSLTESICSQDNIKFGLCESAHCEFTTVDYEFDLKDKIIRPKISVQGYPGIDAIEKINFWKDKSGRMTKGETYTKNGSMTSSRTLWTDNYLIYTDLPDVFFSRTQYVYVAYKVKFTNMSVSSGTTPVYFRGGARVIFADDTEDSWLEFNAHEITDDFATVSIPIPYIYNGKKYKEVQRPYFAFYDSSQTRINSLTMTVTYSIKEIQVQPSDEQMATPEYDPNMLLVYDNTLDEYCEEAYSDPIPLGVFHVSDVKLEHRQNLVKQQVTAYDNIVKLEQNAYNWYTTYMFGMSTNDKQDRYDVQYARQIYSAYFNLMQQLGLESRSNYTETLLATYDYLEDIKPSHLANKWLIWDDSPMVGRFQYAEFTVNNVDTSKMYMVDAVNVAGETDQETEASLPSDYVTNFDSLRRGVTTNGGVLVEFYNSNNVLIDGIVVNRRDYFMVYPNTSYLKIYVPAHDTYGDGTPFVQFIDSVSIYEVSSAPDLVNGYYRLFYYQYNSGANEAAVLFDANSSMTGRDVIHSLLEVCGCFFRLNRETGRPEYVYCTKGGLYPRNDLYPDDDLYPRSGTDSVLPNGRYMSVIQTNYSVKDYGRIQIVRETDSNESKSICEWEFKGSDSPNTYLINDNVFYCNKDLKYEYDAMPYISGLLQNMWINISNMGYVPNITQALGMPWIECGDRVGVLTYTSGFESFIFRRTMKGIQLLIDTFESEGDEYNEAIKDFGYELYNS